MGNISAAQLIDEIVQADLETLTFGRGREVGITFVFPAIRLDA